MPDIAAEKRYRELVRLSYLILPGEGSREFRLALARRIVDRNLPRRPVGGKTYAEARERVLRQSMRPPRRLRFRMIPWLRGLPPTVPGNAALAALAPEERVAYVLRRVTGLRHYLVRDLLVDLGVQDAHAVLSNIEKMDDLNVVAPAMVGRRRRFRRSRVPLIVASALTCALVAALTVENRSHSVAAARTTVKPPVATAAVSPNLPSVPAPMEVAFWEGKLPAKGGRASLVCRRVTLPDGSTRQTGLFLWRNTSQVIRDCADGMTGLWWKAPNRRWFYLAAAGPQIKMTLTGHRAQKKDDGLHIVKAGRTREAPEKPVTLAAG